MRYQPVQIHTLFAIITNTKTGSVKRTPTYYQVRSKSLGNCGHKHTKESAAQPCFTRMSNEFSRLRSEKSKAAWAARKAA